MDIYITEYGSKLRKSGEAFCVKNSKGDYYFSTHQVESFVIEDKVSITTDALKLAITNDIPIILSDKLGNVIGKFWQSKLGKNAKIRRKQLEIFQTEFGSEFGKIWLLKKVNSQIEHIEKLSSRRKIDIYNKEIEKMRKLSNKISDLNGTPNEIRESIMGYEGNISKIYFKCISQILPEKWRFKEREYQGAKEPYNIILNYLYGILYSKVEHALMVSGLDPFLGVFHTDAANKPALLFDFIEQFRFLALEQTATLFSKGIIQQNFFLKLENGDVILNPDKKSIVVQEFYKFLEKKVIFNNKNYSYKDFIKLIAKNFVKVLMEI